MLPKREGRLFAYSNWDAIPVIAGIAHLAAVILFVCYFNQLPCWADLIFGGLYAIAISWNINGVSHNFLHNAYFNSPILNYGFSMVESLAVGFSQVFYHWVHNRHHSGNSDKPGTDGDTIDLLSIYRYGKNGEPENVWAYTLRSFFRDDIGAIYKEVSRLDRFNGYFGIAEIICYALLVLVLAFVNWKAVIFLVPFYYIGNCLSSLNGYYEHLGANPDLPIAWGVSSYSRLYNWIWFNNGYHAEHHYRPRHHWTKMHELHLQIKEKQEAAKVKVIHHAHALGFLG